MIRNHQEDRRKQQKIDIDSFISKVPVLNNNNSNNLQRQFQNEFNESLEYLSKLTKDVDDKKQSYTIKRYPSTPSSLPEPTYGCLKNGKLPTYRTWLNQTRKNVTPPSLVQSPQQFIQIQSPPHQIQSPPPFIQIQSPQPQQQIIIQNPNPTNLTNPNPTNPITNVEKSLKQFSKLQQFENKKNQNKNINPTKWKYPKQKRTIRRTYYVGKSRIHPRISVLVSNKTIRARTTLKQQELKQVPITEVKKYLLKHGFIKVGTSSPNDVLREMYENAQLICGEIKNHNPENLLYNYFHDDHSNP
jgi:hypothetical protein